MFNQTISRLAVTAVFTAFASLSLSACAEPVETAEVVTPVAAEVKSDIFDTAIKAGAFNTLVAAVQAAGLEDTTSSDSTF